ncbi:MAG: hypothetical protein ABH857_01480 [Elusimicrobiota bacterium]
MKKGFLTLLLLIMICSQLFAGAYKIFSEHYKDGAKMVDTVTDYDQIKLELWTWEGSNPLTTNFFGTKYDEFTEGGKSVMGSFDPGANYTATAFLFYTDPAVDKFDHPNDLSNYKYLLFDIKSSTQNINFKVVWKSGASSSSSRTKSLSSLISGDRDNWYTVKIATSDASFVGVNFSQIIEFDFLTTNASATYYIDNFIFIEDDINTIDIAPSDTIVPSGMRKVFYSNPKDTSNELSGETVPSWQRKVSGGNIGTVPSYKRHEIFFDAASTTPGADILGQIEVSSDSFSNTYETNITVSSVTWQSSYNLYKDSVLNGSLGISKGGSDTCTSSDDNTIYTEGSYSLKVDYNVADKNGWATVFFSEPSPRDMTPEFSSSTAILDFYVKTSTDLVISIRSDNITAGEETSKFRLSDYGILSDNNWQRVQICVDDFFQRDQRIDFSTMTVIFNIGLIGEYLGSGASGTFWIDDIKWSTTEEISPNFTTALMEVSAHTSTDTLHWYPSLPEDWLASLGYIKLNLTVYNNIWGVQIYTDNEESDANPKYTGANNPAGLIAVDDGSVRLPMCWRVTESTKTVSELSIAEVTVGLDVKLSSATDSAYYTWHWMKDKNTPDDPNTLGTDEEFVNGEDGIIVMDSDRGIQHGDGAYYSAQCPVFIYIGTKFTNATTPREYKTNKLKLELFSE